MGVYMPQRANYLVLLMSEEELQAKTASSVAVGPPARYRDLGLVGCSSSSLTQAGVQMEVEGHFGKQVMKSCLILLLSRS